MGSFLIVMVQDRLAYCIVHKAKLKDLATPEIQYNCVPIFIFEFNLKMPATDLFMYVFLALGAIASVLTKKLTPAASAAGASIGLLIFKGAGYPGIAMLSVFFISGSWATGWQKKHKQLMNRGEKQISGRTAGQVLANGGVAAISGALTWVFPQYAEVTKLMIAGSFAAAMADTLSSELGTVYGRRFYNILTLKADQRGLDGVISIEGTLIGVAAAAIIALIYSCCYAEWHGLMVIIIAGFAGNTIDSLLGATLERNGTIGNNDVNFLNTLFGALFCLLLSRI